VLLLGDPSTAKSQFLKFVERVAPVGVYTSGKGSSAAGLTASVVRNAKGDFSLEGGAMVLADGGVVCIDEFDKMREEDRVAIHEAMEQQTISVAKAGITTTLNSRAAVLAAANPVFGRYDDMKSAADNIDFLPSILSRFDLIFIVRDVRDEARDRAIASHVMGVHINGGDMSAATGEEGEIDLPTMKRYIAYARQHCAPRLSEEGAASLANNYVNIRQQQREARAEGGGEGRVPITVRQLEALVRISQALAKSTLSKHVTAAHVEEAMRLFQVSTLNAAQSGLATTMSDDMREAVQRAEMALKAALPIGTTKNKAALLMECQRTGGFEMGILAKALSVLVSQQHVSARGEGRYIQRLR
jgi:DNA replication licensing factor MCM5